VGRSKALDERRLLKAQLYFTTPADCSRAKPGEFKNTIQIFLQKVHVEKTIKKFDKNFDVSFFSAFFVLTRFRVFFSDGSSKTLQKTFYKKNRVEKFLQKIRNRPFLKKNYHVFGRFSMRGVKKHDKKHIEKTNLTLVLFRTLTHPPTTGATDFFFPAP
jgi:hypothetical protein